MPTITNVTVAMQCTDETPLVTNSTGKVESNKVGGTITVDSTSWKRNPTPNDGRSYYVLEVGFGRSWMCDCNKFENNKATFSITKMTPC